MNTKHHSGTKRRRTTRKNRTYYVLALCVILAVLLGFWINRQNQKSDKAELVAQQNEAIAALESTPEKKGVMKIFTGAQFRELYDSFAYPNSQLIGEQTEITGDQAADEQIRSLAEARGYQKRSAPVSNTFNDVGKGMLLQQRAAGPWQELKAAAAKDGYELSLTAGYRSAEGQRQIFIDRLGAVSTAAIAAGKYDSKINELLRTTAIPGYSRHHTGYTIDIACDNDPNVTFENSSCFEWLSADNYLNAKKHGWIPSYPDGAGQQGPDPEAWEYVWVGTDVLTE